MNTNRMSAIESIAERPLPGPQAAAPVDMAHYGEDVFGEEAIRRYLCDDVATKLLATIAGGSPFDPSIADEVAQAMKEWAMARGATHFTHWFQPMAGGTAEKHDAFLERDSRGRAIMKFSGKNLVVGEPDASSLPSGGLRCTFEARGYTAWDPTSPAFIKRHANGATLCIPTVFYSFHGEILDKKTPVLRSLQVLTHAVERLMRCFSLPEAKTSVTLGIEQEYFLIDKKFYLARPDLIQTERTLFGAPPAKHQQLEDHYFGAIRPRVLTFMAEVEQELWRLGIPVKTRHNETAPAQFELAPIFESQNLAIDHNMLIMEVLRQVASRHGLVCLLHEKPFAGINGSGKHNNWGLSYGSRNLLDPGDTPQENAIFLTLMTAIIRAVDLHGDLLRAATASAGNDYRLGANEAPPAIISVFLGEQLTEVLDRVGSGVVMGTRKPQKMRIGVDSLPTLPRDISDRNRTSPFAFTGNKFEFRAPGSSQSCAEVNLVLNTIVAESLDYFSDKLEPLMGEEKFNQKLQDVLHDNLAKHKKVIFNGDNYTEEWKKEAARRGLPNLPDTLSSIQKLKDERTLQLFEKYGVLSGTELHSRYEVFLEFYQRKVLIEGKLGLDIARTMIAPAVEAQLLEVTAGLQNARAVKIPSVTQALTKSATALGDGLLAMQNASDALERVIAGADAQKGGDDFSKAILESLKELRKTVDALELLVDDARWPLPKYREMLFVF